MRHIILPLLAALLLFISAGCTHNNGDIGPLFGTWKMTDVSINGVANEQYCGDLFWQFQTSVICLRQIKVHHEYDAAWGSWTRPDSHTLRVDFSHSDLTDPPMALYQPPAVTRLPDAVTDLHIESLSHSKAVFSWTTDNGTIITYHLKRW